MTNKHDRQFTREERKYQSNLLRLWRRIFLVRPPQNPRSINISAELKRPATRKKIYDITVPLYRLGLQHATELIKTSAAAQDTIDVTLGPYDDEVVNSLTNYTVESMVYIADDIRTPLVNSLIEGYIAGESIPKLSKRISGIWGLNRNRAVRFARTATNEIYNQAHYNRYVDSGVVTGTQFLAKIDSRTSDQCRMLNRTIWALHDPDMQRPPLHFFCRSRLLPYLDQIPGAKDFKHTFDGTELSSKQVNQIQMQINTFKKKYWSVQLTEVPK